MAVLIAAQREDHQIPSVVACRALGLSRSWYYNWASGRLPPHVERRDDGFEHGYRTGYAAEGQPEGNQEHCSVIRRSSRASYNR